MHKRRSIGAAMLLALVLLSACASPGAGPTDPTEPQNVTTDTTETNQEEIMLNSPEFMISEKTVRFIGRHHLDTRRVAYGFYNVAAGITFTFSGTSLELRMCASEYREYNLNYVAVSIDGGEPVPICVDREDWYTVAEGLTPDVPHTVTVLKRTMSNAGAVYIQKARLSDDGKLFTPSQAPTRRIQVIGDSITCGYGVLWDGSDTEEVTKWQDGTNSFAAIAARRLGADLEVIAISGAGVGNEELSPYPMMPSYRQEDMQNNVPCDFTAYVPDVVVIALGTNDDGHKNPHDVFTNNSVEMIRFIREQYPEAVIIWTYGAMGSSTYGTVIQNMIEEVRISGDSNVYYLPTSRPQADEPMGQHGHPGMKTHERMADELVALICRITGWAEEN